MKRHTRLANLLTLVLLGCGTFRGSDFAPSTSEQLEPKHEGAEVLVFFQGDPPERAYRVIGMATAHYRAPTVFQSATSEDVVELLKTEARRRGGEALVDVTFTTGSRTQRFGEAKVVVFE